MNAIDRRNWLKAIAVAGTTTLTGLPKVTRAADPPKEKLPVAAVVSTYHNNTHADVIIGKILEGYRQDGGPGPDLKVVSMYTDQVPGGDMSRDLAKKHGFPIFDSIDGAITLGTKKVQVAGVLSICEHGNYPYTRKTNQHAYPRRRFFDGIAATFRLTDQVAPVFSDKHLAFNWADAKHMYDTAKKLKIPFMAGSSVPVAWREPAKILPMGVEIEEAMALGYGGVESYGFHAMEAMQCLVERRKGGETGVKSVRAVTGDELWKAEKEGLWSRELLKAAAASTPYQPQKEPEDVIRPGSPFYLIEYEDGTRSTVAMANGYTRNFSVALKIRGKKEPIAIWFRLEENKPYGHFEFLVKAASHMFHTGKPAYPVERTLLTTGILDRAMNSIEGGKFMKTPELAIQYTPADWAFANQPKSSS